MFFRKHKWIVFYLIKVIKSAYNVHKYSRGYTGSAHSDCHTLTYNVEEPCVYYMDSMRAIQVVHVVAAYPTLRCDI